MGSLNILITGAAGFIGQHTVAAARTRGHQVKALVRSLDTVNENWDADGISPVALDLATADADAFKDALKDIDVVIHAAASLAGSYEERQRDTAQASTRLLDAIAALGANAPALVLVSSIAIYDTLAVKVGGTLDETTPVEPHPDRRDGYCQSKLAQEQLAIEAAKRHGFPLWIMRPGAVFGPNRLWNDHLGPMFGSVLLRLGRKGQVPLCFIDHCADALVIAAEQAVKPDQRERIETINLLDNDLPDRARYLAAVCKTGWPKVVVPWSWRIFAVPARLFALVGLSKRMPGLLRPATLHARAKPIRYSNAKMRAVLGEDHNMLFDHAIASARAAEQA